MQTRSKRVPRKFHWMNQKPLVANENIYAYLSKKIDDIQKHDHLFKQHRKRR